MGRNYKAGVLIVGDSKGAQKAIDLTAQEVENLGKTTDKASKKAKSYSKSVTSGFSDAAVAAAKWSAVALTTVTTVGAAMVKSGLSQVDSLAKTSDKLGIATDKLAAYRFAAEQTGVEQGKFDVALQRMTRRLADAAAGTGPAVDAFKALGLEASELVNLSPDQALARIADQMNKVENQSQKVSLAFKLFDSEGVGLVNTLALGSEGLADMEEQARLLGLSVDRIDAAKVEAANDAWNRARKGLTGFSQQLAVKFAPLLEEVANRLFGVGKEAGGMAKAAGDAFNFVVRATGKVGDAVRGIQVAWVLMGKAFQEAARFIVGGLDGLAQKAVEFYNALPWVDDVEYQSAFSGFLRSMDAAIEESQGKLDDLLTRPLPSDAVEDYVATVDREFEAAAASAGTSLEGMQEDLITTEQVAKTLTKGIKEETSAWDKALQDTAARMDATVVQGWRDMLSGNIDSLKDFGESAKDIFINLLAELAHLAVTRPIVMQLGASLGFAGGTLRSAAGAVGSAGGGLSALSSLPSLLGGGLANAGSAVYNAIGHGATFLGVDNVAVSAYSKGLTTTGLGVGLDLAGGLAGGLLANQVFGETTGIGSTLGGIAGSFIPIPVLGTAIGSFLGGGLESLLGGTQREDKTRQLVDFATGSVSRAGSRGHDLDEAANAVTQQLQAFAQSIGGSSTVLNFQAHGKYGLGFVGEGRRQGYTTETFISEAMRRIIAGAEQLDPLVRDLASSFEGTAGEIQSFTVSIAGLHAAIQENPVERAVADFAAAQEAAAVGLTGAYRRQNAQVLELVAGYDGSAEAAARLNQALTINQQAAYQLALGIQNTAESMQQLFSGSAQAIRESVLTQDQQVAQWTARLEELQASYGTLVDPESLREAGVEFESLVNRIFGSLQDPTSEQAEFYASLLEDTNTRMQDQLQGMLDDARQREEEVNRAAEAAIRDTAQVNQQAADTQLAAAQLGAENMQTLQALLQQLLGGVTAEVNR